MTTPAINIDSGLSTAASLWRETFRLSTGARLTPLTLVTSSTAINAWRTHQRPQSRKAVKDKSGWRAPLPYNFTYENSTFHSGSMVREFTRDTGADVLTITYYYDGYGAQWREQRPFFNSSLENRAVGAALLKLKNQSVNFGVAFGEYKETAELFTSSVGRIAKAVKSFRGKFPREWGQVVKNQVRGAINGPGKGSNPRGSGIPNSWLELQYGWKPTMSDVQASCEELSSSTSSGHPFRCHVTSMAKETLDRSSWGRCTDHAASSLLRTRKGHDFCKVRLDYELASPLLAVFSSLGLTNPLEIVWELVPYSFVVDWAVPIGSWLSSMDADFGWKFLGGSATYGYQYTVDGVGVMPDPLGVSSTTGEGFCQSRQDVLSYLRTPYPSSPRQGLPTVKNPLSSGHIANALALLVGAFR